MLKICQLDSIQWQQIDELKWFSREYVHTYDMYPLFCITHDSRLAADFRFVKQYIRKDLRYQA